MISKRWKAERQKKQKTHATTTKMLQELQAPQSQILEGKWGCAKLMLGIE